MVGEAFGKEKCKRSKGRKLKRLLITTALEETWSNSNESVMFLGEWCRLYSRKFVWEKIDAKVAQYHWDNRKKINDDYELLQELYEELLIIISSSLNKIHGVNHGISYWRIIIGHWLGSFIHILYDRWVMLDSVISSNKVSCVKVIKKNSYSLVPNDFSEFTNISTNDSWNELIYGLILDWMNFPVTKINATKKLSDQSRENKASNPHQIKNKFNNLINQFSGAFSRADEYFFISTYLQPKQNILLQFKLGQIPKFWRPVESKRNDINPSLRKFLHSTLNEKTSNKFKSLLLALIPVQIPVCYLEGYQDNVHAIQKSFWPKEPKAIFTSNAYISNDFFKFWAAEKNEKGTKIITGQHGGGDGTHKWSFFNEHQLAISDSCISWGWVNNKKNILPIGNLKSYGQNWKYNKSGGALLVQGLTSRYSNHMFSIPVASQWLDYFEDQYRFVKLLPISIQNKLVVKLNPQDFKWNQNLRWDNYFSNIILDSKSPMTKLLKSARIYISTYNATTFLESMSMNIPTIIFWNPKNSELNDKAIPYYDELKSAGILHETPESAAKKLTEVWDDITVWWESNSVTLARNNFCEQYSKRPKNMTNDLARALRKVVES